MKMKLTCWGKEWEVTVLLQRYSIDNTLAIQLWCYDEGYPEPFATLTKNVQDPFLEENEAYVDVNNCPWAEELIKKYNLGNPTGERMQPAWVSYPKYQFNLEELKKYIGEN